MTEGRETGVIDLDGYQYVDDDVEAAVTDTELPPRLRERVYETIEERGGCDAESAADIARAVEHRYIETRVDPLDPVGTVSAQSIGEPGTQMTMNTFHYAGVAEIDVTQGLPRLIELVDARKEPGHADDDGPPRRRVRHGARPRARGGVEDRGDGHSRAR